jgi:hypothetical protein
MTVAGQDTTVEDAELARIRDRIKKGGLLIIPAGIVAMFCGTMFADSMAFMIGCFVELIAVIACFGAVMIVTLESTRGGVWMVLPLLVIGSFLCVNIVWILISDIIRGSLPQSSAIGCGSVILITTIIAIYGLLLVIKGGRSLRAMKKKMKHSSISYW